MPGPVGQQPQGAAPALLNLSALCKLPGGAPCRDQTGDIGGKVLSRTCRPHPSRRPPPDIGQPGTEIFNMPAITGAGNPVTLGFSADSPSPPSPSPVTVRPGRSSWVSGPGRRLGSEASEVTGPHISRSHGDTWPFIVQVCPLLCGGDADTHERPAGSGKECLFGVQFQGLLVHVAQY